MAGLRELRDEGMLNAVRFQLRDLTEWPNWTLLQMRRSTRYLAPVARCKRAAESLRDDSTLNLSAAEPDVPGACGFCGTASLAAHDPSCPPCCQWCGTAGEAVEFTEGVGWE